MQERNLSLVHDRADKLAPLSEWKGKTCQLDVHLTEPTKARYRQLFPKDDASVNEPVWNYTWTDTGGQCEIHASEHSGPQDNSSSFLESALCLLFQGYWVNSPFDDLNVRSGTVVPSGDQVQVQTSADHSLGLFLDSSQFKIVTKTREQGVLTGSYSKQNGAWLPNRLEQKSGETKFVVDQIQYGSSTEESRPMLQTFWISAGKSGDLLPHSRVVVHDCQDL